MDIKTAIEKAGGAATIARACTAKGMAIGRFAPHAWITRQALPNSEWLGTTKYAQVICDLIKAMGNGDVAPIELCPGAGQYMAAKGAA